MLPIFIINLEKSVERKKIIQQQFSHLATEIPFEFFNAIYGKENPDFYLFKKYNESERIKRKGNQMNLAQLGCFASHYLLWEKCLELNQPIIILEDDAILHDNFIEAYDFLSDKENIFEFLWLSPPAPARRGQQGKKLYQINAKELSVFKFYKCWGNTTGYYITPAAAKKLLNYCQEWIYDLDITIERYWANDLACLALIPACLEPDLSLESNIPVDKGKQQRTVAIRLRREFYALKDKCLKFIYDTIKG
ncbi:glycosyltransferase family 25 protein [[Haemophilus] ducreyi]|uniref:Lipooligosaccharide galactosyltransferase I n=1 Tax=Haemophilus ducreyi TaxID=730 RepID=A1XRC0_HAEDC|nr:glycosyltransferase family 25 protein [[Haemophilus] ducreyi]ABG36532.1 lipooligosaccharide galactosyltransferase I [[Haemophilus] ducreyi]ANF62375.1 hypothetical protein A6037_06490 [[Haemophilus] ducreyi]ANF67315.1 hypothetical protein A6041_01370 [[Haemophilus] ducreyi]ANF68804.1 hypothetical protein A6042_01975 [[Haemophilus] ducreyi]OOS04510.1 hypothetical protein B0190_02230 [[Haemophilus] ducreyi]